jgi:hypothetical protein
MRNSSKLESPKKIEILKLKSLINQILKSNKGGTRCQDRSFHYFDSITEKSWVTRERQHSEEKKRGRESGTME